MCYFEKTHELFAKSLSSVYDPSRSRLEATSPVLRTSRFKGTAQPGMMENAGSSQNDQKAGLEKRQDRTKGRHIQYAEACEDLELVVNH